MTTKGIVAGMLGMGVLAAVAFSASCGSTEGDAGAFPGGIQVNSSSCGDDTNCLGLRVTSPVSTGSEGSFTCELVDADGRPQEGIELCFAFDSGEPSVVEPSGSCGLTDANGDVSGRYGSNTPGSFQFACRAPTGFDLRTESIVEFTGSARCSSDEQCPPGSFCATGTRRCGNSAGTCVEKG